MLVGFALPMRRSKRSCGLPACGTENFGLVASGSRAVCVDDTRVTAAWTDSVVAGARTVAVGVSPAEVINAAGARSHSPRQGLRSQVTRPVASGTPGFANF